MNELATIIAELYRDGESCDTCSSERYGNCPYERHPKPELNVCHKHSNAWKYKSSDYDSTYGSGSTYYVSSGSSYKSIKSSTIILFTIFLGWLGVHRFYSGKIITGILYACTLGFIGIGVAIDLALIATEKFDDSIEGISESEKKLCWIFCVILIIFLLFKFFSD